MNWFFGDSPESIKKKVIDPQVAAAEQKHNAYLDMIRGMIEGSGYDFFAPKTSTQSMTERTDQTSTPEFGKAGPLVDKLLQIWGDKVGSASSLPPGYAARAAAGIEAAAAPGRTALQNVAARRGVNADVLKLGSPVERQVAAQLADLTASIPLKERELRMEDLAGAQSLAALMRGEHTTGTRSSSGSSTSPADIMQYLQYLGLLSPYESPLFVPQGRQGALGALIGAGATIGGAYAGKSK
jgi:hypothetical protein